MEEKKREEGDAEVKVTDKRRFTSEGEGRAEAAGESPPDSGSSLGGSGDDEPTEKSGGADTGGQRDLPPINFSTFVLSLATSAQVHLGAIPNPATGKEERELSLAKQTIDILGILEEKTKGNLDENEKKLLEHLLFDLRVMYVEANKA